MCRYGAKIASALFYTISRENRQSHKVLLQMAPLDHPKLNPFKERRVQYMRLLEERIADLCAERKGISDALSLCTDARTRSLHENRMNELVLQVRTVWTEYRKLARADKIDLQM